MAQTCSSGDSSKLAVLAEMAGSTGAAEMALSNRSAYPATSSRRSRIKPSAVSKLFSTHPMTEDRIKAAQERIQKFLKPQPEYVIDMSEFQDVQARLAMLENNYRLDKKKGNNRPTLIRRESGKIDDNGSQQTDDSDDRPTLKRRD
jgi:predicted Zn-dependent protease